MGTALRGIGAAAACADNATPTSGHAVFTDRFWHADGVELSPSDFDRLVVDALDDLPVELAALMDNVVVLVEDAPPPGEEDLLGVYDGIALTERDSSYSLQLPDRILLFREPLQAISPTHEELARQIRITVIHEVAHHFGIDDARLEHYGYG